MGRNLRLENLTKRYGTVTAVGEGKATVTIGDIPSDTELEIPLRLALPAQAARTRLSLEGSVG